VSAVCAVITAGTLVTLLSETALNSDANHPDGLTTLTLILATISFFVQIFVFLFQTHSSSVALTRSQDLAGQTSDVLTKIEANSEATTKVLFTQFDRLLDYVVGAGNTSQIGPTPGSAGADDPELEPPLIEEDGPDDDPDKPATRADLDRLTREMSLRLGTNRPSFSVGSRLAAAARIPTEKDRAAVEFLRSFPSREEAADAVAQLTTLSPLAIALLTRLATREIERGTRISMRPYTQLTTTVGTDELVARGYIKYDDPNRPGRMTTAGRAVARVLPIGKSGDMPSWWGEVIAPLSRPS
jgi:hypothetical protein